MCDDCGPALLSRRALVAATPATLPLIPLSSAYAATWRTRQICRDAWRAAAPTGGFRRHTLTELTVHHSGVEFGDNTRSPATMRSIQADHQSRGWPDIAYHLIIDRHGYVFRGRPFNAVGDTATTYDPTGHFLVMCLGNFEVQRIPDAQLSATINVLAWASQRFGLPLGTIAAHRDFAATACPGERFYRYVEDGTLRRRARRRKGSVKLVLACGPQGRRLVRRIEAGDA